MEADDEGKTVKIKKLHKRVFDAIQLKLAVAAQEGDGDPSCGPKGLQGAVLRGGAGM